MQRRIKQNHIKQILRYILFHKANKEQISSAQTQQKVIFNGKKIVFAQFLLLEHSIYHDGNGVCVWFLQEHMFALSTSVVVFFHLLSFISAQNAIFHILVTLFINILGDTIFNKIDKIFEYNDVMITGNKTKELRLNRMNILKRTM